MKKLFFILSTLFIGNVAYSQTCVPSSRLTWDLPECFDPDTNHVLIFAKKTTEFQTVYGEWLFQNSNEATSMYGAAGECNRHHEIYTIDRFYYFIFNTIDANAVDIGDSLTSLIGKDVKIIEAANPDNYLYIPNADVDSIDATHYAILTTQGDAFFTKYTPPMGSRLIVKEIVKFSVTPPTKDPATYGAGDTSLAPLDGPLPDTLKFEHDPLAQLVYNGVGTSVLLTYHSIDTPLTYIIYNSMGNLYSRGTIFEATTAYPEDITNAVAVNGRVQWVPPPYFDGIMVVVNKEDSVYGDPPETMIYYLTGIDNDFSASTSYFNTTDDTNGKVVYLFTDDRFSLSGLTTTTYHVKIFVNDFNCWSTGYEKVLDNTVRY